MFIFVAFYRWHVRSKDNIARVRRDEAKAAEEERQRQDRIKLAEREARTDLLRQKARQRVPPTADFIPLKHDDAPAQNSHGHINFFEEVENGEAKAPTVNKDHEKEAKEEKEKYEKQIGYLTYLGQDTNEALGKRNWYEEPPDRSEKGQELHLKNKLREDPLNLMKKFLPGLGTTSKKSAEPVHKAVSLTLKSLKRRDKHSKKEKKKKKKHKNKKHKYTSESETETSRKRKINSSSSCSSDSENERKSKKQKLEVLRLERLKREKEERQRAEALLVKLKGDKTEKEKPSSPVLTKKYNNQFNPELAKQNYYKD